MNQQIALFSKHFHQMNSPVHGDDLDHNLDEHMIHINLFVSQARGQDICPLLTRYSLFLFL